MARMILTYRVMPEDGEIAYEDLLKATEETVKNYHETVKIMSLDEVDVGFGLKAVKVYFSVEETAGSEALEDALKALPEVGDVVIESMSRAMG